MSRILCLVIAVVLAGGLFYCLQLNRELQDKKAWAALQSVQSNQTAVVQGSYRLVADASLGGYITLGAVSVEDARTVVWILLNEGDEDKPLKALPPGLHPRINCEDVKGLTSREEVDQKAIRVLEKYCFN